MGDNSILQNYDGIWGQVPEDVRFISPINGRWPFVRTEQVFDNTRLKPGLLKEVTKQREKKVDTSLVLGGQIEYTVKLESSIVTGCTFHLVWNNEVLDRKTFYLWDSLGTIKSGVVDIPLSKIRSFNVLTIALTHVLLTDNAVLANVYVTFGYSSEPTEDPPWGMDWMKWLSKNALWIGIGAGLTVAAIVLLRGKQPTARAHVD